VSAWLFWRIVKFASLMMFSAGVFGASFSSSRQARLRAAWLPATFGLALTWVGGWMLAHYTNVPVNTPFIEAALPLSLLSFFGAHMAALRGGKLWSVLSLAGLFAAAAAMSARAGDAAGLGAAIGLGALVGAGLGALAPARAEQHEDDLQAVERGFKYVAWAEGASLLFMLCVNLPFKFATGERLDGHTGMVGFTHGILVIQYTVLLVVAGRTLGWSWKQGLAGFVASLLPAGTFVFEKKVLSPPTR